MVLTKFFELGNSLTAMKCCLDQYPPLILNPKTMVDTMYMSFVMTLRGGRYHVHEYSDDPKGKVGTMYLSIVMILKGRYVGTMYLSIVMTLRGR